MDELVQRLRRTLDDFLTPLRRQEELEDAQVQALRRAVLACVEAWHRAEWIPKRGIGLLVELLLLLDAAIFKREGQAAQRLTAISRDFTDLIERLALPDDPAPLPREEEEEPPSRFQRSMRVLDRLRPDAEEIPRAGAASVLDIVLARKSEAHPLAFHKALVAHRFVSDPCREVEATAPLVSKTPLTAEEILRVFRASLEWRRSGAGAEWFVETVLSCGEMPARFALDSIFDWLHRSHSLEKGLFKQRCPLRSPGPVNHVSALLATQPVFHHLFVMKDNALWWRDPVSAELRDELRRLAAEGWKPSFHVHIPPRPR